MPPPGSDTCRDHTCREHTCREHTCRVGGIGDDTAVGRRAFLRDLSATLAGTTLTGTTLTSTTPIGALVTGTVAGAATGATFAVPWARPAAAQPPGALPPPWLDMVRRPPPGFSVAAAPPLPPLLPAAAADGPADGSPDGRAPAEEPSTAAAWPAARERIERAWQALLGPAPASPPLAVEVLGEDEVEGCRRRRVRYACEEGLFVEAFLLFPPAAAPAPPRGRPGVVAFHSTTDSTNECIAGLRDGPDRGLGVALARRGFVTACPRCFLWQEPGGYAEQVRRFRARLPGALGMRKMLHDGSRAVDLLAATAGVDAARIGCCGHSLGAKEALYLAAFDRRIRAAVAHDGGLGRRQSNWEADWYLGPDVPDRFDHHQLLALAAPRPLLVQGGGAGAADGVASWPLVAAALPVYRALPGPAAVGLDVHDGGHRLTDRAVARLVEWLAAFLAS